VVDDPLFQHAGALGLQLILLELGLAVWSDHYRRCGKKVTVMDTGPHCMKAGRCGEDVVKGHE
jgi:hypothetical protein